MKPRWWAPTTASTTPDSVVLALLSPDGDPAGDLGASLLGFHRAGASACEQVAKGAVPSCQGLADALTHCHQGMTGPLLDAVSKSVEENYAALLIRDLRTDADQCALALYQSCVNKGVAPPLAASRAGAVYGVPSHALGRYAVLATDPKANQLTLTDAADRVLLGYVAKMVAAEVDQEVVSKATAVLERPAVQTDFDPKEHPRGTGGRFVDAPAVLSPVDRLRAKLGIGRPSPAVVVAPAEPEPVARAKPKVRERRGRRQRRGSLAATGQTLATEQTLATATMTAQKLATRSLTANQQMMDVRQQLGQSNTETLTTEPLRQDPIPMVTGGGDYGVLSGEDLVFTMTHSEGQALRKKMFGQGTGDDPRVFPMHMLVEKNGKGPEKLVDPDSPEDDNAQQAHYDEHVSVADLVLADIDGYSEPSVKEVLARSEAVSIRADMSRLAAKNGYTSDAANDREVENNIAYVQEYVSGQQLLVHIMPRDRGMGLPKDEADRPKPIVDEFMIPKSGGMHDVRGNRIDTGGDRDNSPHWEFDPNQIYVVAKDPKGRDFTELWDDDKKVFVHRFYIIPIDPQDEAHFQDDPGGVIKAWNTMTVGLDFEREHPRDKEGQFSSKTRSSLITRSAITDPGVARLRSKLGVSQTPPSASQPAQEPAAAPAQQIRRRRGRRQRRGSVVEVRRFTSAEVLATRKKTMATQQMRQIKMTVDNQPLHQDPPDPVRDPKLIVGELSRYKVFTPADWNDILDVIGEEHEVAARTVGQKIPLIPFAAAQIRGDNQSLMTGFNTARDELGFYAKDVLDIPDSDDVPERQIGAEFLVPTFAEDGQLQSMVGSALSLAYMSHPEYDKVTAVIMPGPNLGVKSVKLVGNSRPVPDQYLVEVDPSLIGLDLKTNPVDLVYLGRRKGNDIRVERNGTQKPMIAFEAEAEDVGDAFHQEVAITYNVGVHVFRVQPRTQ